MAFITRLLNRFTPSGGVVLLFLSISVGAVTGLAAVAFIRLIGLINYLFYGGLAEFFAAPGRLWFILVPVIGALLGGPIIAWFAAEAKGHGVPEVMAALILRGGRIRPRVAVAKIIASALCIGTGGSAGREGPIVQVGSTFGSSVGQWLKLSDKRIKNLVACGAAAGIAATFNAPLAGIVFSLEVLAGELQVVLFGNVVLAAVSASIVSRLFLGARPAFSVPAYVLNSPWEILLYTFLGLLAALTGIFFIRLLDFLERFFDERVTLPPVFKPAIGAALLGLLAYFYPHILSLTSIYPEDSRLGFPLAGNIPHIYGSGFDFIDQVLKGQAPFILLFMLIFLKPLATSFTLGSGNSGGVFAPSLFTGAMLGGAFGHLLAWISPGFPVAIGAYALVGMAAVFAAAARAPLTAMLIVFEMSNDYQLILPLMAACMTASYLAQGLNPDSIYTIKLSRRGIHFDQGHDLDIMQGVRVEEVMNAWPVTIGSYQSLAELFALFQETHHQGFPVLDEDGRLYGMVSMQDIHRTIQEIDRAPAHKGRSLKDIMVRDVATTDLVVAYGDEPIWMAIRKMAPRDLARMPVVDRNDERRLVGIISRSEILKAYQVGLMRKQHDQTMRERMILRTDADVQILEERVAPGSLAEGRKVSELNMHQSTSVISINRDGEVITATSDTVFAAGDLVTMFCRSRYHDEIRRMFSGPGEEPPGPEKSESSSLYLNQSTEKRRRRPYGQCSGSFDKSSIPKGRKDDIYR